MRIPAVWIETTGFSDLFQNHLLTLHQEFRSKCRNEVDWNAKQAIDLKLPRFIFFLHFRSIFLQRFYDSSTNAPNSQSTNWKTFNPPTPANIITQFISIYYKQWNINYFHNYPKCMAIDENEKSVIWIAYNSYSILQFSTIIICKWKSTLIRCKQISPSYATFHIHCGELNSIPLHKTWLK